jgi:xanthine dehydrogenase/oxidase
MQKAGALVNIYTDGSVIVNIHGIEMGQGLHTKVTQFAANQLNVPMESVFIAEISTDKIPNSSPTAASVSFDLCGMAVYEACKALNERLKPYRDANPNASMKEIAMSAYLDRVNLSAFGFYKNTDINFDWKNNKGRIFHYMTLGVALSMVELDVLTGDHTILRTDIIMDIGQSINFALDVGQIEGAFMQGLGLFTLEESLHQSSDGAVFTRGPGNYKIPAFRNVPVSFNIKLLKDKEYKDLNTLKSSKGIGEPPLFLASSVFFALRDAVIYARFAQFQKKYIFKI